MGDIDLGDGIWAAGGGVDLKLFRREFGKVTLAGGSEGFYANFSLGSPLEKNHRKDW